MSAPSTRIAPAVGSSSRTTRRATVDLPLPDSPTSAERLARAEGEATRRRPRAPTPPRAGKCLTRPSTSSSALTALRRPDAPRRRSGTRRGAVAERTQLGHRRRGTGPRRSAHRGWNAQPGGSAAGSAARRGWRRARRARRSTRRAPTRADPRVYGCRGRGEQLGRPAPSSTTRPAYITTTRSARPATTPRSWVTSTSARPHLAPQLGEQLEDLRLRRDVERGGGLVGDEHLRPVGQRHREHHPLAHAARELVRVARAPAAPRARSRPRSSSSTHRGPAAAARRARVHRIASATWSPTRCTGLSAVIGSWNTIARSRPRTSRYCVFGEPDERPAVEPDVAVGDPPGRVDEPHHRQRGHRLARARLADDRDRLARVRPRTTRRRTACTTRPSPSRTRTRRSSTSSAATSLMPRTAAPAGRTRRAGRRRRS